MDHTIERPGYRHAMLRYASFSGRATRSEFWLFLLVSILIGWMGVLLDHLAKTSLVYLAVTLVHLVPSIAVFVRRLHDTNRSGWLYLWILTIVGVIPLLVFACMRGTPGPNRFGVEDPAQTQARLRELEEVAVFTAGGASTVQGPIRELERLAELRGSGAISDEEFAALKARVVGNRLERIEPRF